MRHDVNVYVYEWAFVRVMGDKAEGRNQAYKFAFPMRVCRKI